MARLSAWKSRMKRIRQLAGTRMAAKGKAPRITARQNIAELEAELKRRTAELQARTAERDEAEAQKAALGRGHRDYQFLTRRSGTGVRRDAGEGDAAV